jgi:peptide/nickel transport system substrate-binding protein
MVQLQRRRTFRYLAAAIAVSALTTAGCSSIDAPTAGSGSNATGGTPRAGGTLKYLQAGDVNTFDPAALPQVNYVMLPQLFDTLVSLDAKLEPQPELAESWEFGDDRRKLTLHLKEGVVFHDGTPFTADSVVFTWEHYRDPEVGALIGPLLSAISKVEAVDEKTVVLHFSEEPVSVFDALDLMFVIPKGDRDRISTRPIGTGPFKLDSRRPGVGLTLVRNEKYWKAGVPYLDKIEVVAARDQQAAIVQLESGAGDILLRPQYSSLSRLEKQDGISTRVLDISPNMLSLHVNVGSPELTDPKVRKAISLAINRKRIAETVLAGTVQPSCLPWSKGSPAYVEKQVREGCAYDPAAAKKLLAEAGFDGKAELSIVVQSGVEPAYAAAAEIIAEDLRQIGVSVSIEPAEEAEAARRLGKRDYDLYSKGYGRANRDPVTTIRSTAAWRPEKGVTGYTSPAYADLVNKAAAETDPEARKQLFEKLNQLILDESFMLTITSLPTTFGYADRVGGLTTNLEGMPLLDQAWIAG